MILLATSTKTPIGTLHLLADEQVLLGASFGSFEIILNALEAADSEKKVDRVKRIPKISDLIDDYFSGDVEAINAIAVRQPGAAFSQSAWKAMRKIKAGKTKPNQAKRGQVRRREGKSLQSGPSRAG